MPEDENQQAEAAEETGAEETPAEDAEESQEETAQSEEAAETSETEKPVDYRAKLNAQNNFLKKEGYEFKDGKWVKPAKPAEAAAEAAAPTLSEKDVYALVKADVAEEDIDEVKAYAGYRKISVADALKDATLKSILSVKAEERRTAAATNTRSARGTAKVNGETLIDQARQGKAVKEEDIDKLVDAETAGMRKK